MHELVDTLRREARYLGNGMIKADAILNHRVDVPLMTKIGSAVEQILVQEKITGVTRVVTAEASGIAPAFACAQVLGVPLIYARKQRPSTMSAEAFTAQVHSRTKNSDSILCLSPEYISDADRALIVDDFLGTGGALRALVSLIRDSGADIAAAVCVIEKAFEGARESLQHLDIPIFSLARAELDDENLRFELGYKLSHPL